MIKKLISFVIPAYKEEKNVPLLYKELISSFQQIQEKYDYEIIFVNDGSPDDTWWAIQKLCEEDKNVVWVNLSRNFWKEIAISAGMDYVNWDAVITLDGDGQHPVEKIPDFIQEWENGYDMVYNKRPKTKNASFFKKLSSKFFYLIYNTFSDFKLEPDTTDYRLLDKKLVEDFKKFSEKNRMYRGLTDWLWYNKKALVFDAKERLDNWESSYTYKQLYNLAINSLTSFSVLPLKMVGYLGFLMTFISGALFLLVIIDKFTINKFSFSNIAAILLVNTILIGIVLMSLGLMALYIAKIHQEVQGRPMYIVKNKINFKK